LCNLELESKLAYLHKHILIVNFFEQLHFLNPCPPTKDSFFLPLHFHLFLHFLLLRCLKKISLHKINWFLVYNTFSLPNLVPSSQNSSSLMSVITAIIDFGDIFVLSISGIFILTFLFQHFVLDTSTTRGTAVAQWLRYCATNHKVTGSIPDGVFGIFH
jgi:hypothetical protein